MLAVDPDRLSRLLYAFSTIGLLDVEDERFRNGSDASTFLDASKTTYRGGDHALLRELWIDFGGTPGTVLLGIRERWPNVAHFSQHRLPVSEKARSPPHLCVAGFLTGCGGRI